MNNEQQTQFLDDWSTGGSSNVKEVEKEYDTLAQVYEQNVLSWNYACHEVAAELMVNFVDINSKLLDLGCGTGLAGSALQQQGYQNIVGVDISQESLAIAQKKNVYTELYKLDIQQALPFQDNEFNGIVCTAVMTNIANPTVLYEFIRVIKPGGYLLFTNREDMHYQRKFDVALKGMESDGMIQSIYLSSPQPYLPDNQDYAEKIQVLYCVYKVYK